MAIGARGPSSHVVDEPEVLPRDDRAWPRSALVASGILCLVAVAAGVGLGLGAAGRGPLTVIVVSGAFVVAFGFGFALTASGIRRWIAGHPVPGRSQFGASAGIVVALLVMGAVDAMAGGALLAGLIGGILVANVWAIRRARSNRELVDKAEAALAREPTVDDPRTQAPRRVGSGVDAALRPTVGQALRHVVGVERHRCLAWLIATAVATSACAVLDAPEGVTFVVVSIGGGAFVWVARRLWAAWLANRDFTQAATSPRRAFVVLLRDPAPKLIRPLLGVWSEPPMPRGGRLPKAERVFRCDDELDELLCHQGSVEVHEAWVDTGRRRGSKPRWVAADAGIVLPHRRAVFGRGYLSALIGGDRPGRPQPLTLPPPHSQPQPISQEHPDVGSLAAATTVRLAGLSAIGIVFHWIT
jgi:hypothetical protein